MLCDVVQCCAEMCNNVRTCFGKVRFCAEMILFCLYIAFAYPVVFDVCAVCNWDMRFPGSTFIKTTLGVTSSMRFFHLGPRRPRSGACWARSTLTSDDPGRSGYRVVTGDV